MLDLYRVYQRTMLRKRLVNYLLITFMLIMLLTIWGRMQQKAEAARLATLFKHAQMIHKQKCLHKKDHASGTHKSTTLSVHQLLTIVTKTIPDALWFEELLIKPNHIFIRGQFAQAHTVPQYLQILLPLLPSKKQYRLTFVNTKQFTVLIHSPPPKNVASPTITSPSLLISYHQLLLQEIHARHIQIKHASLLGPNKIELTFLANFASSVHLFALLSQLLGDRSCLFIHLKHGSTRNLLQTRILCQWR